jgi:hypothetical protein
MKPTMNLQQIETQQVTVVLSRTNSRFISKVTGTLSSEPQDRWMVRRDSDNVAVFHSRQLVGAYKHSDDTITIHVNTDLPDGSNEVVVDLVHDPIDELIGLVAGDTIYPPEWETAESVRFTNYEEAEEAIQYVAKWLAAKNPRIVIEP